MRRLLLVLITLSFISCGTSKVVRDTKQTIKGSWLLSSISYSASGSYNVTLLNDTSKACFEDTTWHFVPNNNTGIYTISKTGCPLGERYFVFTIDEVNAELGLYDFLLKPTNEKYKSETNNQGFRLKLKTINDTSMQWDQTVTVEGEQFVITMKFTKI